MIPAGATPGYAEDADLVLFEHHLRRFDDNGDLVSLLETQLLGAAPRNHTFDLALSDPHDHMSHNVAESHLNYFSFKLVSC